MNKKIISALILACLAMFYSNSFAQDNNEAKTLFASGNPISAKTWNFLLPQLMV